MTNEELSRYLEEKDYDECDVANDFSDLFVTFDDFILEHGIDFKDLKENDDRADELEDIDERVKELRPFILHFDGAWHLASDSLNDCLDTDENYWLEKAHLDKFKVAFNLTLGPEVPHESMLI